MSQTQEKKLEQSAVVQTEEAIDRAGYRIGLFAGLTVQRIQSAAARVREEAEDVWAEAQNIRHENSPTPR